MPPVASVGKHTLSGTVAVFDPAMCCATGVCGPGVDPALLTIARDLRWLEAQGVRVHRAGLGQEPQAFVANAKITGLMQAFGDGALPAVLVNDDVLVYGRYATRDELVKGLSATALEHASNAKADDSGGRAPGTGCR
ncbi:MAG: arsenite efflux transporter metallochaperone ArsD [Gemmatimonadaceae bacterium]|nr:arsenite efflux transporter metallochaperone ArsD [Gemmatimonadaceae bacterium]